MTPADAKTLAELAREVPGSVEPATELARASVHAWIACETTSDVPLAYAVCSLVIDEVEILALATRPEARRRGAARALLDQIAAFAAEAGARRVSLEVARSNVAARQLYESAGFDVFNVRRAYYRATGEDALEMELVLPAS